VNDQLIWRHFYQSLAHIDMLTHWRVDPGLVGLGDPNPLDKIPPAESVECRKLVSDLDTLIDRTIAVK